MPSGVEILFLLLWRGILLHYSGGVSTLQILFGALLPLCLLAQLALWFRQRLTVLWGSGWRFNWHSVKYEIVGFFLCIPSSKSGNPERTLRIQRGLDWHQVSFTCSYSICGFAGVGGQRDIFVWLLKNLVTMNWGHKYEGRCTGCEISDLKWQLRTQEILSLENKSIIAKLATQIRAQDVARNKETTLIMETVHHQSEEIFELRKELLCQIFYLVILSQPWKVLISICSYSTSLIFISAYTGIILFAVHIK